MPISASELYALSQGTKCEGPDECHWCAAKCDRKWIHDDVPPILHGRRILPGTKRHANAYICIACYMFRRPRLTVEYLSGGYRDGQFPPNHSWWITEKGVWGIRTEDYLKLWDLILHPPLRFVLALKEGDFKNHLHLLAANDHKEVLADTPNVFTINGVQLTYTTYELSEAFRRGVEGKSAGVRELIRILGNPKIEEEQKRGRGRPPKFLENEVIMDNASHTKKTVTPKSGTTPPI